MKTEAFSVLSSELRSSQLIRVDPQVALGNRRTVAAIDRHDLFCGLLGISGTGYHQRIRTRILSEGMSETLSRATIDDRILSCAEPPSIPFIDLRTARQGGPLSSCTDDGAAAAEDVIKQSDDGPLPGAGAEEDAFGSP